MPQVAGLKRLIYGRPHLRTLKFKQLRTGKQAQRSFDAAFRTSSASSSWRKRSKNLSAIPHPPSLLPRTTLQLLSVSEPLGTRVGSSRLTKCSPNGALSMHPRCIRDSSPVCACLHALFAPPFLGFRAREILCILQRSSLRLLFLTDWFVRGMFRIKREDSFPPFFSLLLPWYILEAFSNLIRLKIVWIGKGMRIVSSMNETGLRSGNRFAIDGDKRFEVGSLQQHRTSHDSKSIQRDEEY